MPVLTPSLSPHRLRLVTRADSGIARKLVDRLTSDLPGDGVGYWPRMGGRGPTPLDAVIRQALDDDKAGSGERWERAARWMGNRLHDRT